MNILENNLSIISKYNPVLADKIINHSFEDSTSFEFVKSKSDDINLIYNGTLIHCPDNPQQEAINTYNEIKFKSENSSIILFGLGIGYLFKRLCLDYKGTIVLYEPNLDILRFTLEVVDFSQELGREKVFVANSKLELIKFLDEKYQYKSPIGFCALKSSSTFYSKEISELMQEMPKIISSLEANYICLFEKSFSWINCSLKNLPALKEGYNLDSLRNAFISKPAVIVSSGPSLDKNAEFLSKYRDRVILYSVANAYKTLAKYDIKPDFLAFIESYEFAAYQVKDLDIAEINLIAQPITHNTVFDLGFKRKFAFYSSNDLFSRWISNIADFSIKDYENKGNVSYCALFSAMMMGCNPIILLGQDLAYSDGQCYSKNSPYGSLVCIKDENTGKYRIDVQDIKDFIKYFVDENYGVPPEEHAKNRINELNKSISFVKGQNGEMLPTDPNYASFVDYLEQFAYEFSEPQNLQLINSSTGGAQINGFKNLPIEQVLTQLDPLNIDVDQVIQKTLFNYNDPVKSKINDIINELNVILKELEKFEPQAKDALEKANKLTNELKNTRLNLEKISHLSQDLIKTYIRFREKLFNKHQILTACAFKQLYELTVSLENESQSQGLDDLISLSKLSSSFFDAFIIHSQQLRSTIESSLNKLKENAAC